MPLSVRPSIHPPTHPPTHECLHLSAYLVVLTGDRPLRLCLLHREHLLRHGTRLLPHKYLCGEAADRRRRGSHHGLARRAGRASRTAGLVVVADVVVDVVVALCSPCSPETLHSAPLHPGTSPAPPCTSCAPVAPVAPLRLAGSALGAAARSNAREHRVTLPRRRAELRHLLRTCVDCPPQLPPRPSSPPHFLSYLHGSRHGRGWGVPPCPPCSAATTRLATHLPHLPSYTSQPACLLPSQAATPPRWASAARTATTSSA